MKVSQQAHVVLSLGQRQLQTPMLEGNSLRASRVELLRQGLQVGEVSAMSMPGQSADTIVLQNPKPGAGAATPRVDVLVSEGPRETDYVMPHLVGLNENEAQRRLDQVQMRRKVNYVSAPQWPRGAVIDQSPMAGSKIPSTATIELTVANSFASVVEQAKSLTSACSTHRCSQGTPTPAQRSSPRVSGSTPLWLAPRL